MIRPIKFRAYQKTPSLNHKPGLYEVTGLDFYEGDYGGGEVCLRNEKGEQWTEYIKDVVLEQCTGLKDKNGKEIYEGDIVRNIEGIHEPAICVWDDSNAEFDFRCRDGKYTRDNVKSWLEMYEVIGNIHEDKELLDGSD